MAKGFPETLSQKFVSLYSLNLNWAEENAVAVCPEGKERLLKLPSLSSFTICIKDITKAKEINCDVA